MSQDYYILKTLNMKDKNIHFYEEFVKEEVLKDKKCLVYQAYLTYIPEYCPKCGTCYDEKIEKHGFKNSLIKIPSVSKINTYLSLNKQRYLCHHCNRTFTCTTNIVNYLVSLDKEFKDTYQVYQDLLYAFQNNNINVLENVLNIKYKNISEYMIISIKTIKSYINYIKNTFNTKYHNGYIEGNNNFIKTLKRIAFEFRSFTRFKARIMICKVLINPKQKEVKNLSFSTS